MAHVYWAVRCAGHNAIYLLILSVWYSKIHLKIDTALGTFVTSYSRDVWPMTRRLTGVAASKRLSPATLLLAVVVPFAANT